MTEEPRFGPHRHDSNDTNDHSLVSSRRDGIDIEHRLQEMEKQRRVILNATDDERLRRCMRLVGADLGATQRLDFDAASELHDGIRAHREGQR